MKARASALLFACGTVFLFPAAAQVRLPSIPGVPGLPTLSLPAVPGLPSSLPAIPALPSVPSLPSVPTPNVTGLSGGGDAPTYPARESILSIPDARLEKLPEARPPFLEVIHVPSLKTYQSHRQSCQKDEAARRAYANPNDCPQYEWSLPLSPASASQDAARDLRRAWQRLEDRYYFHTMARLNNPAYYIAFCWLNFGSGVNPATPDVTVHVPDGLVEPSLRSAIPSSPPKTDLFLDNYWPIPQVENTDFCDDLSMSIVPIMFIPGFCINLLGADVICTPDFPKPIWFNDNEAARRVQDAIVHAHTRYLSEYQEDAIKALTPGEHALFAVPWRSNLPGDGAFVAPVFNESLDPSPFTDLGSRASSALGGLLGVNATAYYLSSIARAPTLNLLTPETTGNTGADTDRPGVWKLEEFKRLLPPSNPTFMERVGYASLFEAWNEMTATILPEPNWAKVLRAIVYWAVGIRIVVDFTTCGVCPVPVPYAVPVAPHLLPFVGPRMLWGWVSVPEGYDIPRVKGTPLFDYRPLLRAGGL